MAKQVTDKGVIGRLVFEQPDITQRPVTAEGSPAKVRLAVGSARTPEDRLATLQAFYPDARPYGNDNFVYTDETGQTRRHNPKGLDLGDFAGAAPEIGSVIGGTLGALGGGTAGALGGGVGAIPAGAAMAGVGANAGRELTEYLVRSMTPQARDTRTIADKLKDQTLEVALGTTGEGAGRAVGEMATDALRSALVSPGAAARSAEVKSLGLEPAGLSAEIGGRPLTRMTTNALAAVPSSTNTINTARAESLNSFADAVARISQDIPTEQGALALRQGQELAADAFRATQGRLADDMWRATDNVVVTPTDMQKARLLLSQWDKALSRNPNAAGYLSGPADQLRGLIEDAQSAGIPFRQLRERLTDITQNLKAPQPGTNYVAKSGQAMRAAERALRNDARTAVANQAPDAVDLVRAHDEHVARYLTPTPAGKSEASLVETMGRTDIGNLRNWALGGSKNSGERLQALRGIMPATEWDTFQKSVLADWGGSASTGDFSVARFVTEWNKHSEQAKRALFGDQYGRLSRLARVGEDIKKADIERNMSKTAQTSMMGNILQGSLAGSGVLYSDPLTAMAQAALTVGGPYTLAKGLTGPGFQAMASGAPSGFLQGAGALGTRSALQGVQ